MILLLVVLAVILSVSLLFFAYAVSSAPLGEEFADGFQITWCNNTPEARDVSCVWDLGEACPA